MDSVFPQNFNVLVDKEVISALSNMPLISDRALKETHTHFPRPDILVLDILICWLFPGS